MGHIHGWMSDPYLDAVNRCDHALGKIVDAAKTADKKGDCFNLVVLSDHGGSGQHHNTGHPDVLTIPFIAYGKSVRKGHRLAGPISILDVAPTIAQLMDILPHPEWLGKAVSDLFVPPFCKIPMMQLG